MTCELVTALTPDTVRLHGLYFAAPAAGAAPLDACLILHGLGGNFYNSKMMLRLNEALLARGVATVLANTRGHDGISMNVVSGRAATIGAAFENVDDCRHDVRGWVDWLVKKGHQRIGLLGHSLGAIKSLYAQAHDPHPHVTATMALSASRLSHQQFLQSGARARFLHWFGEAERLVRSGNGERLLRVDFPFPTYISAQAYFDKYGPEDHYNWLTFADRITTPTLLLFGEREVRDNPAFQGILEDARTVLGQRSNWTVEVVPSADHYYSGVHQRAAGAIVQWLDEQSPP